MRVLTMAILALMLPTATACTTPMTKFLRRNCVPDAALMAPETEPARPPWRLGSAPTAEQIDAYIPYLWSEIKVRDLKHAALAHHVSEHCGASR